MKKSTRTQRRFVLAMVLLGAILSVGWVAGVVFELEYPYWPTLWRVSSAVTWKGERVSDVVLARFPLESYRHHWTTSSYCAHKLNGPLHPFYIMLKVTATAESQNEKGSETTTYDFAFYQSSGVLVPASQPTAVAFPGLMPHGAAFEVSPAFGRGDGTSIFRLKDWVPPGRP